jgi:glycosyltransferase involved in cell wall biosynthesis
VVFLGAINRAKGVDDLVAAWRDVHRRIPQARLVIAGSGEVDRLLADLPAGADAAGIDFPGWIDADDRARLLRRAWLFVLPSHAEALPMSILESMAAGVPVVASRVGGIPTAVVDGETGVLIEPGDVDALARAIHDVIGDEARRTRFGRAARARVEAHFSAEARLRSVDALWSEVIAAAAASRR